eukprot:TRINITY_DN8778_c0_g3_i2.p1 TRINITY_DN8778_c0_g3~~TRINITY_DN8778_c0_g3_i2.p1  ORF type:complete len:1471 (-),score=381.96 TRINITY_DN8778_c0_g3_i2:350-4762(-)
MEKTVTSRRLDPTGGLSEEQTSGLQLRIRKSQSKNVLGDAAAMRRTQTISALIQIQKAVQEAEAEDTDGIVSPGDKEKKLSADSSHGKGHGGHDDHDHHDHHGHDTHHHEHPPSIVTAVASAVTSFVIFFSLCGCYGMIIFYDGWNARHIGIAVKAALISGFVLGAIMSLLSNVPIAVGGPDMNAVIFVGDFVHNICVYIAEDLGLQYPDGPGNGVYFCEKEHLYAYPDECEKYHKQVRATSLFSIVFASLATAAVFGIIGSRNLTRFVNYVPTSIVDAFLSCMGYKVIKYALKFTKGKPRAFLPAAGLGVLLYFLKAMHIVSPLVLMSAGALLPLGVFHIIMLATGTDMDTAREEYIMFPEIDNEPFYHLWTDVWVDFDSINFSAWMSTLPSVAILVVVLTLDHMVTGLRTTEQKLPVRVNKRYEISLAAFANFCTACLTGLPGYIQLKFTVINYATLHNAQDRRAAAIFAVLCGVSVVWTIEPLNYMPRWFMSTVLFFSGSSFIAEHLWASREYLKPPEWATIIVILTVFVLSGDILAAVTVGGLLTGISFIFMYSNVPCTIGDPMRGGQLQSNSAYDQTVAMSISLVAEYWMTVVRLKGYLFFGSVTQVSNPIREEAERQVKRKLPKYERLRYAVLDCEQLDGLDTSAEQELKKLSSDLMHFHGIELLWSNLSKDQHEKFIAHGTLQPGSVWFEELEDVVNYMESLSIEYRGTSSEKWLSLHPAFALFQSLAKRRRMFEPFDLILASDAARLGCPWSHCSKRSISRYKTVLWEPGQKDVPLYLVHSGAVGLFPEIPCEDESWHNPIAIYRHGWLLNRESVMHQPSRLYAVALEDGEVISWDRQEWTGMAYEDPMMHDALCVAVMHQTNVDMARIVGKAASDHHKENHQGKATGSPLKVERQLMSIQVAQLLESGGFYEPLPEDEAGTLPLLPARLADDMRESFKVFQNAKGLLSWNRVVDALMYVGIFNTLLLGVGPDDEQLTEAQFLEVCQEAAMMRLSKAQVSRIEKIFRYNGTSELHIEDIADLLSADLGGDICPREVASVANCWASSPDAPIDMATFTAVVSRIVRKHEHDWNMVRGLRDVLKKKNDKVVLAEDELVRPVQLTFSRHTKLGIEDAEELTWAARCFVRHAPASEQGKVLDLTAMVASIILDVDEYKRRLPPLLKDKEHMAAMKLKTAGGVNSAQRVAAKMAKMRRAAKKERVAAAQDGGGAADLAAQQQQHAASGGGDAGVKKPLQIRKVVVDLRSWPCDRCHTSMFLPTKNSFKEDIGEHQANLRTSCVEFQLDKRLTTMTEPEELTSLQWLYMVLNDPSSSPEAMYWSVFITVVILASVAVLFIERLAYKTKEDMPESHMVVWQGLEVAFSIIFTLEAAARFTVWDAFGDRRFNFFKSGTNICDVLAVVPAYVDLIFAQGVLPSSFKLLKYARLLRLARIGRVARLATRFPWAGPTAAVLTIVWGIYLKEYD